MGRIIAIDYGSKRCGFAVTDPLRIIATPLEAVVTESVIGFLKKYLSQNDVECFVIGDPKNLNNTPSHIAGKVNDFIKGLQKEFPGKKLVRVDERFTSKIATQTIIASGKNKSARRNKSLVDKLSAVLILQHYLASAPK